MFDPNGVGLKNGNIFSLPYKEEESRIVLIPAPWDVTVSYRPGTANGPEQIIEASSQIDYHNHFHPKFYEQGIHCIEIPHEWKQFGLELRAKSESYISALENNENIDSFSTEVKRINEASEEFNDYIKHKALYHIEQGKKIALIGGDHSCSLGMLQAFDHEYKSFGVLQIDAHADLREAYEGFEYSHASIMFNALKLDSIKKLVQVGIRDICEEELNRIEDSKGRIKTFYDSGLKQAQYQGETWKSTCLKIIDNLPEFVYISFDIDGLNPNNCPNTGTPVPSGLEFEQACYLIEQVKRSGRKIIGFDLVEVSNGADTNNDWDANVGMRLLYRLCSVL
jgi:agmatinase